MNAVCVVCKQDATVFCENDKAYLCSKCDVLVHSANCVVSAHVRKPIKQCLDGEMSTGNFGIHGQVEGVVPVNDRKFSLGFDLEAFLCNEEDESFNLFETKEWEERLDIRVGDWGVRGGTLLENTSKSFAASVPLVQEQQNTFTVTTGTPEHSSCIPIPTPNPLMVPCFSSTTFPSVEESDATNMGFVDVVPVVPQDSSLSPTTSSLHSSQFDASGATQGVIAPKASPEERAAKIARYRAKKDKRNFKKKIRYQTRKAYAEVRPRIKGRFAKQADMEAAKLANQDQFVVPDCLVVP